MKTRLLSGAVSVLCLCLVAPASHAQPKVKAKDVPTPKDRCFLTCDAKLRQCLIDGTREYVCNAGAETCRKGCYQAPLTE